MSDSIFLGLKARQLEDSPAYQPISCVKLTIGGEDENGNPIVCTAGNPNSGRTIETSNPLIWDASIGNTVAQNILAAVQGYAYKPFTAEGSLINPAVEIGDAVEVGDVYSVIADVETTFSPLMSANISAPVGSDIDHEYPYESSENRELMQQLQGLKTSFIVENGRIAAEISDVRQTEQGLQNNITQLEMTVNGIHAYTDQEIKTISGGVVHDWAEINFTPQNISSKVSSYFDAKGAADTALTNSKSYTDGKIAPIAGQYTSAIEQSAKQIMATVAAAETIWDTSTLSQTIQNNIATYGYGTPPNSTASQYNGKYYLDQTNGTLYKSNGSKWTKQSTQLQTIQTTTNSKISINSENITSLMTRTIPGIESQMSKISQKADSISLSVSSNVYGQTTFTLSNNQTVLDTETLYLNVDSAHITGTIYADSLRAYSSIVAPTIYDSTQSYWLDMGYSSGYCGLQFSKYSGGSPYRIFGVYDGDFGYVSLSAKGFTFVTIDGSSRLVRAFGTWDFSNATVYGLPS